MRLCLASAAIERAQLVRGVADERDIGLAETVRLVGVDVDPHHLELVVDAPVAVLDEEARADRQHGVGVLPQAMADRHVDGQPMRGGDDAAAAPVGRDRRFQHLGDMDHLGAGIERAAAQHEDRPLGIAEDLCRGFDRLVVDDLRRQGQRRVGQRHFAALGPGVERAFQRDGTRPARGRLPDRLADQGRRFLRPADALRPFGDVAHQAELVVDLVQMAVALVDVGLRDLADQPDHRRVHAVGREHRGTRVQQAGAGHHAEGLRLAGRKRGAQRHVGRGLLVARMDHPQAIGCVVEGVEQRVLVQAGQGIDRIEAVAEKGFDRGFGGAEAGHQLSL